MRLDHITESAEFAGLGWKQPIVPESKTHLDGSLTSTAVYLLNDPVSRPRAMTGTRNSPLMVDYRQEFAKQTPKVLTEGRVPSLPDDNSELEPPDPIPNSAVKRLSADGSVGFPHVRVGHRQA